MTNMLPLAVAQAALPSEGSWDSLIIGIIFFMVACGATLSVAKRKNPKQDAFYVSKRSILSVCCALNFIVGAIVVQIAATAAYLALFNGLLNSLVIATLVLVWGLLALSSGIYALFKKSVLPLGAVALSMLAIVLGVTDNLGVADFSSVLSASVSMVGVTSGVFFLFGLISLMASVGAAVLYVPQKLSVTLAPKAVTVEIGKSHKLVARASGGVPNYSFKWHVNGQQVSDDAVSASPGKGAVESSFILKASKVGSNDIYVVVEDHLSPLDKRSTGFAGKRSTATSQTISVTVVPAPLVTPIISAYPSTIDVGQSSLISQSKPVSGGVKPYSYQWLQVDSIGQASAIPDATSDKYTLYIPEGTRLGTKGFQLKVNDSLGTVVVSNVVSVKLNAAPTVVIAAESQKVDAEKTLLIRATASGGTQPLVYGWYVNNLKVAQGTESVYCFVSQRIGTNEVYVTVDDSATPAVSAKSNVLSILVAPIPLSAPVVGVKPSSVAVGQTAVLSETKIAHGGVPPYRYQWLEVVGNRQPTLIEGATQPQLRVLGEEKAISEPRSYSLRVTDSAGTVVESNRIGVKVNPPLTIESIEPLMGIVAVGQPETLTVQAVGGTGEYRYEWYVNNGRVSGNGASFDFSAKQTGLYKIYVKVYDSAEVSVVGQSETCSVINCILPKAAADINKWLNDEDWDRVVGFDLLEFVQNTESEEDFLSSLDVFRDCIEDYCADQSDQNPQDWPRNYTNAAITQSYRALQSGQRNLLYTRRIAPRIFNDWKLTRTEDIEKRTGWMNTVLEEIKKDVEKPWTERNIQTVTRNLQLKILGQIGLDIGMYLAGKEQKRYQESLFFLKDAVNRIPRSNDRFWLANNWLGVTLGNLDRYSEAIPYLRTAVEVHGSEDDYRLLIGALMQQKQWGEAKRVCEEFGKKLKFSSSQDILYYAIILAHLEEFDGALYMAKEAEKYAKQERDTEMEKTCNGWVDQLQKVVNQRRNNPYGYYR
ncbi:MAG: hypothetical protein NWE93_00260 [Candidatus Bathyarchaeota archaeon]|nr:hypothetical protein [Candidatus Bathyarchaeota archaeon]